jgi:hypothetical protein
MRSLPRLAAMQRVPRGTLVGKGVIRGSQKGVSCRTTERSPWARTSCVEVSERHGADNATVGVGMMAIDDLQSTVRQRPCSPTMRLLPRGNKG